MKAGKGRGGYTKPMGSALRAARLAREAAEVDPKVEAAHREGRMLASLSGAREDFEWLAAREGWKLLGYANLADWWQERVQPVVDGLALKPAPALAKRVVEIIKQEEESLPKNQRRTARELAALVGTSEWTARGRQDLSQRRDSPRADLGKPDPGAAEPAPADIPPALGQAIADTVASIGAGIPAPAAPAMVGLCPSPVDPNLCAGGCGTPISWPDRSGGNLRCSTCDPSTMHRAVPHGPGWLPECEYCTSKTATGTVDATPVDAGGPQRSTSGPAAPTGSSSPEPVGVTPEDLDEGEAVVPPADSPAAAVTSLPDGDGDPTPEPDRQPGQDSPTGRDRAAAGAFSDAPEVSAIATAGRSETDHHRAGVSGGEVRGDSGQSPAGPEELEDGVPPAVAPSSSDDVLRAFAGLLVQLQPVDVDSVGPLLLDEEMELLYQHVDWLEIFVRRLASARTP